MTDDTAERAPLSMRMKRYELGFEQRLPRRAYTLMRLDGSNFRNYLRNADKPFDLNFIRDMNAVAGALCRELTGVRFAYTQSDEISLLLTDFQTERTEPWYDGRVAKMVSLSASKASVVMERLREQPEFPLFDCRAWSMSDPVEVANYFVWRQQDAINNSIQMLGQHFYEPTELFGLSTETIKVRVWEEHGVHWHNDIATGIRQGRIVDHVGPVPEGPSTDIEKMTANWRVRDAPYFLASSENWLATVIPPLPSLWTPSPF